MMLTTRRSFSTSWEPEPPSKYALVGIDQYSEGFRAGYFLRGIPRSAAGSLEVVEFRKTDS